MELTKAKNKKAPPVWPDTKHADCRAILEAIQAGKRALDAKPRMDMPGAVAIPQQRDFGKTY